ncbi:hypothetical protein ADUPG1_006910, partial [Aduncisulcus paluster]
MSFKKQRLKLSLEHFPPIGKREDAEPSPRSLLLREWDQRLAISYGNSLSISSIKPHPLYGGYIPAQEREKGQHVSYKHISSFSSDRSHQHEQPLPTLVTSPSVQENSGSKYRRNNNHLSIRGGIEGKSSPYLVWSPSSSLTYPTSARDRSSRDREHDMAVLASPSGSVTMRSVAGRHHERSKERSSPFTSKDRSIPLDRGRQQDIHKYSVSKAPRGSRTLQKGRHSHLALSNKQSLLPRDKREFKSISKGSKRLEESDEKKAILKKRKVVSSASFTRNRDHRRKEKEEEKKQIRDKKKRDKNKKDIKKDMKPKRGTNPDKTDSFGKGRNLMHSEHCQAPMTEKPPLSMVPSEHDTLIPSSPDEFSSDPGDSLVHIVDAEHSSLDDEDRSRTPSNSKDPLSEEEEEEENPFLHVPSSSIHVPFPPQASPSNSKKRPKCLSPATKTGKTSAIRPSASKIVDKNTSKYTRSTSRCKARDKSTIRSKITHSMGYQASSRSNSRRGTIPSRSRRGSHSDRNAARDACSSAPKGIVCCFSSEELDGGEKIAPVTAIFPYAPSDSSSYHSPFPLNELKAISFLHSALDLRFMELFYGGKLSSSQIPSSIKSKQSCSEERISSFFSVDSALDFDFSSSLAIFLYKCLISKEFSSFHHVILDEKKNINACTIAFPLYICKISEMASKYGVSISEMDLLFNKISKYMNDKALQQSSSLKSILPEYKRSLRSFDPKVRKACFSCFYHVKKQLLRSYTHSIKGSSSPFKANISVLSSFLSVLSSFLCLVASSSLQIPGISFPVFILGLSSHLSSPSHAAMNASLQATMKQAQECFGGNEIQFVTKKIIEKSPSINTSDYVLSSIFRTSLKTDISVGKSSDSVAVFQCKPSENPDSDEEIIESLPTICECESLSVFTFFPSDLPDFPRSVKHYIESRVGVDVFMPQPQVKTPISVYLEKGKMDEVISHARQRVLHDSDHSLSEKMAKSISVVNGNAYSGCGCIAEAFLDDPHLIHLAVGVACPHERSIT